VGHAEQQCPQEQKGIELARRNIPAGPWSDFGVVWCDERAAGKGFVPRRIEPGTFPMVDGSAYELDSGGPLAGKSRVGTLRGFGNAIVPILAAEFIKACLGIVNQES
jgi:DNA (cytosine-5)-methyltransferase 1